MVYKQSILPFRFHSFKGTVIQIEKAVINDCFCVSKVFWKLCISTIYTFAVIYSWNLLFS